MTVHSGRFGQRNIFRECIRSHCKNRNAPGVPPVRCTDCLRGIITVHNRHLDIHKDQIVVTDRRAAKAFHRLAPIPCRFHLSPQFRHPLSGNLLIDFVVFHQQNPSSCQNQLLLLRSRGLRLLTKIVLLDAAVQR